MVIEYVIPVNIGVNGCNFRNVDPYRGRKLNYVFTV
jgi:hypothetical protein